jgi:hypothetical protein
VSKPKIKLAEQVREACKLGINRALDDLGKQVRDARQNTLWDYEEVASRYPQAWQQICEQVEDVKRCSDGATFLFLCAIVEGPNLCVLFADDMNKPPDFAPTTEFRAPIATVQ